MKNDLPEINKRFLQIIEEKGYTGYRLAKESNLITQSKLTHIRSGRNEVSADMIKGLLSVFPDVNYTWISTGKGDKIKNSLKQNLKQKTYAGQTSIKVVSLKAQAGWSDEYYSDEYLKDMPTIIIESDENYKGNYMAFEVMGHSMEPEYYENDIVICREVQRHLWTSKLHYKDWDFVIAHSTKGIMLKEITAHDVDNGIIKCHSLNPEHPDFEINLREVAYLYNVVEVRQKGRNKKRNR